MELVPFDKRNGKIWFNNQMVKWTDAKIHVLLLDDNFTDSTIEFIAGEPDEQGGFAQDTNPLRGEKVGKPRSLRNR